MYRRMESMKAADRRTYPGRKQSEKNNTLNRSKMSDSGSGIRWLERNIFAGGGRKHQCLFRNIVMISRYWDFQLKQ